MPDDTLTLPTLGDLRAERGRKRVPLYKLAPLVDINPCTLGGMLNERLPMSPDQVRRVADAIERWGGDLTPWRRGKAAPAVAGAP